MGLINLLSKTLLGWGRAGRPNDFDLGPNSKLHNTASLNNMPPLSSFDDPYIRKQKPTKLGPGLFKKYLDNLPK